MPILKPKAGQTMLTVVFSVYRMPMLAPLARQKNNVYTSFSMGDVNIGTCVFGIDDAILAPKAKVKNVYTALERIHCRRSQSIAG